MLKSISNAPPSRFYIQMHKTVESFDAAIALRPYLKISENRPIYESKPTYVAYFCSEGRSFNSGHPAENSVLAGKIQIPLELASMFPSNLTSHPAKPFDILANYVAAKYQFHIIGEDLAVARFAWHHDKPEIRVVLPMVELMMVSNLHKNGIKNIAWTVVEEQDYSLKAIRKNGLILPLGEVMDRIGKGLAQEFKDLVLFS